ncbi:MAG: hypothetical protein ACFCU4_03700 [Puniceicoccaceae bacterium]
MIARLGFIFIALLSGLALRPVLALEEGHVRFLFRTYPLFSDAILEDLHYQTKPGEFAPLKFRRLQRSIEDFTYQGPPTLTFFSPDPSLEAGYAPVAEIDIPSETGPFLIFVLPTYGSENPDTEKLQLAIINDSFDRIPDNTVSFLNFTNAPLVGILDVVELDLGPGLSGPFSLHDQLGKPVIVGLAVRRGDSFRKVLQNRWTFRSGERNLVVLAPPRRSGSFRIQAFHLIDSQERAVLDTPPVEEPSASSD